MEKKPHLVSWATICLDRWNGWLSIPSGLGALLMREGIFGMMLLGENLVNMKRGRGCGWGMGWRFGRQFGDGSPLSRVDFLLGLEMVLG